MKCRSLDEQCYEFHEKDGPDTCFLCRENTGGLFVVRQVSSMKMVHLCGDCMVNNSSEYLLDNTRPWEGNREKGG